MSATSVLALTDIRAQTSGDANGAYSNAGIDIDNSGDIDHWHGQCRRDLRRNHRQRQRSYSNTGIAIDNVGDMTADRAGIVAGVR